MNQSVIYNKQEALSEIVELATRHNINCDEIATALGHHAMPQGRAEQQKGIAARLFSYIGGILIFSGLCIFVGMFWDQFSPLFRVLITFGTGTALFVAAVDCAGKAHRQGLVTPLILVSAFFQPGGMLVAFDEYGGGGDWRYAVLTISGVMFLQYALTFTRVRRELLAWLALVAGSVFFATITDLLDIDHTMTAMAMGISYLCIASALSKKISVRHCDFWFALGGILLLGSFYDLVQNAFLEPAFAGLCALLVYLSITVKSRGLLTVATLGLIWYIGYYAFDVFADSGMFPLALIAAGGVFMGLGSLAMRLDRRFIRQG